MSNAGENIRLSDFVEDNPKTYVQGLYVQSSTQKHPLGTRRSLSDGREFIYAYNAANIEAGIVVAAVAPDPTNHANLVITANKAVGDKEIPFTMGDDTAANTANAFAEGYAYINTGSGVINDMYKIRGHAAIAGSANGVMKLYDAIRTAITTSHKVSLAQHPLKGIQFANGTGAVVGVTHMNLTANYYGWIQTKGYCCISCEGTCVVGNPVFVHETAGEVGPPTSANAIDQMALRVLGTCIQYHANDHSVLVDLDL